MVDGRQDFPSVPPVDWLRIRQLQAVLNPAYGKPGLLGHLFDTLTCGMPIVCYYNAADDIYEIVDGFHRYSVMLQHDDIRERESGMLPVSVIEKPLNERMASTIRHNRARGSHSVDLLSDIVSELHKNGCSDSWLEKHLGMDKDEVLRLKQITGLAEAFKDYDFSMSWIPVNIKEGLDQSIPGK